MIEVENLKKSFKFHRKEAGMAGSVRSLFHRKWEEKPALKGVSLRVSAGEILGLVGANGAGKTTLVKALAGIIHPTSGTARVLGYIPWERHNDFRRSIALIMGQKAQLWWDLPAEDCFLLLREIYRIPKAQFEESLAFLVESLDVKKQLNIQIRRLSLGERMKMELIAALLHRPQAVFLDEPTIGLDLTAQKAIRKFLLQYRKDYQPAMILTSHYMEDIVQLCERIVIIREGEFVYDGSLSKVVNQYATQKVITAKLAATDGVVAEFPAELGKKMDSEPGELKFKIARDRIPEAAGVILKMYPVADLNIEEEDIGTVIETLIREGVHH